MRSFTFQEGSSWVQLVLLTTVGLFFVTPVLHYISGVLHRRNSRPRQDGLRTIVEAKDATIDIVAVHGLGAHPEFTWTVTSEQAQPLQTTSSANAGHASKKPRVNWLKDDGFLKEDFKTARIMTFGYNADWFVGAPMATAEQRAGTLLRELKRARTGVEGLRPVLFIGHSFGGIIIKHAICEAEINMNSKDIYDATCGIIFLGTPHQGSDASYPGLLVALLTTPFFGSKAVLPRLLQKHSTELSTLREKFSGTISRMRDTHNRMRKHSCERLPLVYTFIETKDTLMFNFISLGRIVDRDSASTDLAKETIAIDKNHSGLNKCYSRDDMLYRELHSVIREILGESSKGSYMLKNRAKDFVTRAQRFSIPELRAQDVSTADLVDKGMWYTITEEYKIWERADTSVFLWFRGRLGTGKTSEISKILRFFDEGESVLVDKVAYFCPKTSLRPATILRSIVIQLGRNNQSRVDMLDDTQKSDILSLIEPGYPTGIGVLWNLFQSLLQPCLDRKICLVLDGIDALHSEDLEGFATTLHRIWSTAKSESTRRSTREYWFKVLITSRPNVQLAEIFRNETMIDPDTEISECLHSLALGAGNPRQNDKNISKPARRTGEWIVTDPRYETWAKSESSDILWLIGKPGSGKSTLLLRLLKESLRTTSVPSLQRMLISCDSEASMQNERGRSQIPSGESDGEGNDTIKCKVVASYFYNFRNESEVDNGRMLQSVLFQILSQESRLFPLFRSRYLQLRGVGSKTSIHWTFDDFTTIFREMTEFRGCRIRIELFLDAVDESKHSSQVMEILRQQLIGRTRSDVTIKAIVARRPMEALLEIPLDRKIQMELHNATDIEKLINEGIEEIEGVLKNFIDRVDFNQHCLVEFKENLKKKADGVVLWVSVALTTVKEIGRHGEFTVDSMMKTLDDLPSDLEQLYAHIVCRLREQKEQNLQKVKHRLRWTTNARRTLSVKEFFHAIALSENLRSTYTRSFQLKNVLIPHATLDGVSLTLSSSCGGFLEVQAPQSKGELFDSERFLIRLIHRSVRTFLEKEEASPFRVVKQECNLEITDTCIRYLRFSLLHHCNVQDSDAFVRHLGQHSLLAYILTELSTHLMDLGQGDLTNRLQELTSLIEDLREIDLSHPGLLIMHTWTLRLLAQTPCDQDIFEHWKAKTKSELAKPPNITTVLQAFLRNTIVAAIKANHFHALKTIFGAGALLCDEEDRILSAGLDTATKTNNPAILEFIGEHRTVIDPTNSIALRETLREALETACKNGYEVVSKWLLERGAISATKDQGCTALYLAVNAGHELVVKRLLEYGINPHHKRNNARSLLWIAAEKGHEKLVRILLQFGADPNIADDQGRRPLVMAREANHEAVVKLLLSLTTEDPVIAHSRPKLLFLVPVERNPNFIGREDLLQALKDALKSQKTRIALVGLGGLGKTQTVTEFAYRVFEEHIASSVLWMNASSDDTFLRDHEYICQRFQWALGPKNSPEAELAQFYGQLELEPGTKLVIWDSLDCPSDLITSAGSLLSTKSISVLITSRDPQFSQKFAEDTGCIHLQQLSISESTALLRANIGMDADNDTLRVVVNKLGGLPLAISLAAEYMSLSQVSPLEYLSIFEKTRKNLLDFKFQDDFSYHTTLEKTWEKSVDHLEREDAPAFKTLSFMSILDASHIPKYLLLRQSSDLDTQISMKDLDYSIASLRSYSLLQLTQDQSYLDLHRLVQDYIRRRLYKKGDLAAWENAALKAVSYEFPQGSFEEWEKCGDLLPHALAVLKCDVVEDDENSLHHYRLLRNAGAYTMKTGSYAVAQELLEKAYVVSLRHFGPDSEDSQSVGPLLAQLYLLMGEYDKAEVMEDRVIETSRKMLGEDHSNTLSNMSSLASIYLSQGRYHEAEKLEVQVSETRKRVLGTEHPTTLSSMSKLALLNRE